MPDDVRAEGGLLALVLDELLALRAASDRLEAQQHNPQTVGALLDELRGLRRDVAALRLELRRPVDDVGGADLAALVDAIHREVGEATFRAEDLLALSLHRPALAAALAPFVDADADLRAFGKTLARARDRGPFGDLAVDSLGRRGGRVMTWRVRALSRYESAPSLPAKRAR